MLKYRSSAFDLGNDAYMYMLICTICMHAMYVGTGRDYCVTHFTIRTLVRPSHKFIFLFYILHPSFFPLYS